MDTKEQVLGAIRHIATFLGGILVARGKIDAETVQTVIGVVATMVGLAWSMFSKDKAKPSDVKPVG